MSHDPLPYLVTLTATEPGKPTLSYPMSVRAAYTIAEAMIQALVHLTAALGPSPARELRVVGVEPDVATYQEMAELATRAKREKRKMKRSEITH